MKGILESGRSMVEMLGVLAIVGVLSIGGIMGYSYGMDKYRANETINDIMLRRSDLLAQHLKTSAPNLDAWKDETTIYPIDLVEMEDEVDGQLNTVYGVGVSGVHFKTCQMIAEELFSQAQIIINGYQYNGAFNNSLCNQNNANEMDFYFVPNAICRNDADCGSLGCGLCINGTCDLEALNGESCGSYGRCQSGKCIAENCDWRGWLDSGRPTVNKDGGEYEPVINLCREGTYLVDVHARPAMFPNTPISEIGQTLSLDTVNGLVCHNKDQVLNGAMPPVCLNYEVEVCCCQREELEVEPGMECDDNQPCCRFGWWIDNGGVCETVDGKKGYCSYGGECRPLGEDECRTYEDCDVGEYCHRYHGACYPLLSMTQYTINGKTYYLSEKSDDYFLYAGSEDYCNAFGKQKGEEMVSITFDELRRDNEQLVTDLIAAGIKSASIFPRTGLVSWSNTSRTFLGGCTNGWGCGYSGSILCHNPNE